MLTPKQEPWIEKMILRATELKPEMTGVNVGGFQGVTALFAKAKEHLKYPKVILQCEGQKVLLSVAGAGSKFPGMVNVMGEGQYPDRPFFGRVSPEGQFFPSLKIDASFREALIELLIEFGNHPSTVARKYGKLTGQCAFCGSPLTDEHSTAAGYGPTYRATGTALAQSGCV